MLHELSPLCLLGSIPSLRERVLVCIILTNGCVGSTESMYHHWCNHPRNYGCLGWFTEVWIFILHSCLIICVEQIPRKGTSVCKGQCVRFGFLLRRWPGVWLPWLTVRLAADLKCLPVWYTGMDSHGCSWTRVLEIYLSFPRDSEPTSSVLQTVMRRTEERRMMFLF